jgi:type IV pilus biogenesis protein CpaD/CtpE
MNKFFLMLMTAMTLGLSACASMDRSTASSKEDDVKVYKPTGLDRHQQF